MDLHHCGPQYTWLRSEELGQPQVKVPSGSMVWQMYHQCTPMLRVDDTSLKQV